MKAVELGEADKTYEVEQSELSAFQANQNAGEWMMGAMPVDPSQGFKAKEIQLFSFARPHMRAFHYSWLSFFIAFTCWFAFAPLMPIIRLCLGMPVKQVFAVNIASVASTVSTRFIVGPLCDKIGPKRCQTFLLAWITVFVGIGAAVSSGWSLGVVRFMIGFGGATFVVNQFWTSQMFANDIVGLANACTAGWGNLGGGVTQMLMAGVYVFMKKIAGFGTCEAWRPAMIIPAALAGVCALGMYLSSDDSPRGDLNYLYDKGVLQRKTAKESMKVGYSNINSWLLGLQYATCFGVELHMNNAAALYFAIRPSFDVGPIDAALIASLFGWMNLFARSAGGYFSDLGNKISGMRGRLWAHTLCLFFEGLAIIVFSRMATLQGAIPALMVFSFFVQAAEGTSFGIVPYVEPTALGGVCAVVGAWGNIGAVAWGMLFLFGFSGALADGFATLGCIIIASAFVSFIIRIKGQSHLLGTLGNATSYDKTTIDTN
uniref:Nitrate/nitrite transporter n=1 Tax=Aureoumbra lagunensis TaxID=44058 RepID=A0A7S3JVW9_9STRA|mmetsp:Transcript_14325/g.19146  ORF Transcript_14325/g.19146 Transcript_14325/m.19146 type:complete len:487 (+) Transcript_14325:153-1613(+)